MQGPLAVPFLDDGHLSHRCGNSRDVTSDEACDGGEEIP